MLLTVGQVDFGERSLQCQTCCKNAVDTLLLKGNRTTGLFRHEDEESKLNTAEVHRLLILFDLSIHLLEAQFMRTPEQQTQSAPAGGNDDVFRVGGAA